MNWEDFAIGLGFSDKEALMSASDIAGEVGDVTYFVTLLSDGRWAAWDDCELALDRVSFFASKEEAIQYQLDGIADLEARV